MKKLLNFKCLWLLCLMMTAQVALAGIHDYNQKTVEYKPSNATLGSAVMNSSGDEVRLVNRASGDNNEYHNYENQIAISGAFGTSWTYRYNNNADEWYLNTSTPQTLSIMNLFPGDKVKIVYWSLDNAQAVIKSNNTNKQKESTVSSTEMVTMTSTGSMDFLISHKLRITSIFIQFAQSNTYNHISFDTSGQGSDGYSRCQLSSRLFNEPALSVYPSWATVTYTVETYDKMNGSLLNDPDHAVAMLNMSHNSNNYHESTTSLNKLGDLLFKNLGWVKVTATASANNQQYSASYWVECWDNEAKYEFRDNNTKFIFVPNDDKALADDSQKGGFLKNRVITGVGGIEVKFGIPVHDLYDNNSFTGLPDDNTWATVHDNSDNHYQPNTTVVSFDKQYGNHMVSFTNSDEGWWDRMPYNDHSWPYQGTFYTFEATAEGKLQIGGIKNGYTGSVYLVNLDDVRERIQIAGENTAAGFIESQEIPMKAGARYALHGQANNEDGANKWAPFLLEWFSFKTTMKLSAKYGVAAKCGATNVTSRETITGATNAEVKGYKGTITHADVSLSGDKIVFSNITYNTSEENKKGGAIKVRLSAGSSYVDYVMTIPYGQHVWDFRNADKDAGTDEPNKCLNETFTYEGLVADMTTNAEQNAINNSTQVEALNDYWYRTYKVHRVLDGKYNELVDPILTAKSAVEGNNAFYLSYTNGLVFLTQGEHFGAGETANVHGSTYEADHGLANIDDDVEYRQYKAETVTKAELVWMEGNNATILFPGVKAGQYIKIWTKRHSDEKGETWTARNLVDLDGVAYDESIQFLQRGINNDKVTYKDDMIGGALFRVPDDYEATNDLTKLPAITMADGGWVKIYKIEIMDECKPDLYLTEEPGDVWGDFFIVDHNTENSSIVVKDGTPVTRIYDGQTGRVGATQAHTCKFDVEIDPNVQAEVKYTQSNWGSSYNRLIITYKGGYGLVKIIQRELGDNEGSHQYVYSKNETYIAVGELTTQQYPYTWDFTDYNMFMGAETNHTEAKMAAAKTEGAYGIWTGTAKPFTQPAYVDVNFLPQINVTDQPYKQTRKPLFSQGSQLSAMSEAIAETQGLGIYRPLKSEQDVFTYYFTINKEFAKRYRYYSVYDLENDALKVTGGEVTGMGKVLIPNVDAGMYVFVKASAAPTSVTGAASSETYSNGSDTYQYKVTAKGDVILAFAPSTEIQTIGVTNIDKKITKYHYATESRDRAIDYVYTGTQIDGHAFISDKVNAYGVHDLQDTYNRQGVTIDDQPIEETISTPNVKRTDPVNVVNANTGIVLYAPDNTGEIHIPLFVPAVNHQTAADFQYGETTFNDVSNLSDNMMAPNVEQKTYTSEKDGSNYIFILSPTHWKYVKEDGKEGYIDETVYEGVGFYRMKLGTAAQNTLAANSSYLRVPDTIGDALWAGGSGANNAVIFADDLDGIFSGKDGIENVMTDATQNDTDAQVSYYTLSGVKINGKPSAKGIYICNGKKVLVK